MLKLSIEDFRRGARRLRRAGISISQLRRGGRKVAWNPESEILSALKALEDHTLDLGQTWEMQDAWRALYEMGVPLPSGGPEGWGTSLDAAYKLARAALPDWALDMEIDGKGEIVSIQMAEEIYDTVSGRVFTVIKAPSVERGLMIAVLRCILLKYCGVEDA